MESGEKSAGGLVMGVVFGLALHTIYGSDSRYLKILYSGLTLLVTAMFNCANDRYAVSLRLYSERGCPSDNASQLGKISFLTIGTLLFTR